MSKLDVHNKQFMLFISAIATKQIEILLDPTLKRPPLFNGTFFKLYLRKQIIVNPEKYKQVDLKFKIKIPENVTTQIVLSPVFRDQLFEIQNIQLRSNVVEHVQLEVTSKNKYFIYTVGPGTEIARLQSLYKGHLEVKYNLTK